jgi:hypothetical protein
MAVALAVTSEFWGKKTGEGGSLPSMRENGQRGGGRGHEQEVQASYRCMNAKCG